MAKTLEEMAEDALKKCYKQHRRAIDDMGYHLTPVGVRLENGAYYLLYGICGNATPSHDVLDNIRNNVLPKTEGGFEVRIEGYGSRPGHK